MVNVEQHTSSVGVAATRREKAAMIDEVKAVNRMSAILTFSFIRVSFYILSVHTFIAHCHNRRFIKKIPPNLE